MNPDEVGTNFTKGVNTFGATDQSTWLGLMTRCTGHLSGLMHLGTPMDFHVEYDII